MPSRGSVVYRTRVDPNIAIGDNLGPRGLLRPEVPTLRIISNRTLREFWEPRLAVAQIAERDLTVWRKLTERSVWPTFAALRQTFPSAHKVGNCVVFDAGNNRYWVICRINHERGIVYVLKVMDHGEYDRGRWKTDCGCFDPPPRRARGR
jgi:mRNA interferase HigB